MNFSSYSQKMIQKSRMLLFIFLLTLIIPLLNSSNNNIISSKNDENEYLLPLDSAVINSSDYDLTGMGMTANLNREYNSSTSGTSNLFVNSQTSRTVYKGSMGSFDYNSILSDDTNFDLNSGSYVLKILNEGLTLTASSNWFNYELGDVISYHDSLEMWDSICIWARLNRETAEEYWLQVNGFDSYSSYTGLSSTLISKVNVEYVVFDNSSLMESQLSWVNLTAITNGNHNQTIQIVENFPEVDDGTVFNGNATFNELLPWINAGEYITSVRFTTFDSGANVTDRDYLDLDYIRIKYLFGDLEADLSYDIAIFESSGNYSIKELSLNVVTSDSFSDTEIQLFNFNELSWVTLTTYYNDWDGFNFKTKLLNNINRFINETSNKIRIRIHSTYATDESRWSEMSLANDLIDIDWVIQKTSLINYTYYFNWSNSVVNYLTNLTPFVSYMTVNPTNLTFIKSTLYTLNKIYNPSGDDITSNIAKTIQSDSITLTLLQSNWNYNDPIQFTFTTANCLSGQQRSISQYNYNSSISFSNQWLTAGDKITTNFSYTELKSFSNPIINLILTGGNLILNSSISSFTIGLNSITYLILEEMGNGQGYEGILYRSSELNPELVSFSKLPIKIQSDLKFERGLDQKIGVLSKQNGDNGSLYNYSVNITNPSNLDMDAISVFVKYSDEDDDNINYFPSATLSGSINLTNIQLSSAFISNSMPLEINFKVNNTGLSSQTVIINRVCLYPITSQINDSLYLYLNQTISNKVINAKLETEYNFFVNLSSLSTRSTLVRPGAYYLGIEFTQQGSSKSGFNLTEYPIICMPNLKQPLKVYSPNAYKQFTNAQSNSLNHSLNTTEFLSGAIMVLISNDHITGDVVAENYYSERLQKPLFAETSKKISKNIYELDWSDVINASSYQIYMYGSPFDKIHGLICYTSNNSNYSFENLDWGYLYFRVRAVNEYGYGIISDLYQLELNPFTTMIQLTINDTKVYEKNIIKLEWTGFSEIFTYMLYRSSSPITTMPSSDPIYSGSATSYTMKILENKKYYYVVVASINHIFSNLSNVLEVPIQNALEAPAVSISWENGQMQLTWAVIEGAIRFEVYRTTVGELEYYEMEFVGNTTGINYIDLNLSPGKYYYRVVVYNQDGEIKSSAVISGIVPLDSPKNPFDEFLKSSTFYVVAGAVGTFGIGFIGYRIWRKKTYLY